MPQIMYNDFVAKLTLLLLGTSQIALDEQPIAYFRSINVQGILIYLALHPSQAVSRDVLAALFWPDEPQRCARANLRQSLYQLRTILGDMTGPQRPFLLVTRHSVQLNPQGDYVVDVHQFLEAIANHDLGMAVSLYKGDLLPGFACDSPLFENWLRQERESLHSLAMAAMHELAQDHLQAGHLDKAQAIARRQLRFEPWCETAHRQLMQANALAGNRTNALAQYEACWAVLNEELGLAPSPLTTTLFEDIKTGKFGPAAKDRSIQPPRRSKHNLPAETTPLIGRDLELAQVSNLFTRYGQRLVTIVGPGGMGKTRLALAAGYALREQYQNSVYFVDLAPLERVDEIPAAIGAALDFQPPDKSGDLFPQLLKFLRNRQLLLILDNFEHLLQGTKLIAKLMATCPNVAILTTSRQQLNMDIESRFELGGLEYPQSLKLENPGDSTAVQLFVDSGRRVRSEFDLYENNIAGVVRICQLVQGMPLGLILAASWLGLLSPAEIADEIEGSLQFLAADLADLPPRQRSIQALFERSWAMLAPDEQAVLASLSIFRGGFSRQAAEQVAGANLRILLSLVSKSLVQRRAQNGCFALHELLRQFAAAKRHERRDCAQIPLAHCRYFAQQVQEEFRRGLGFWPNHLPKALASDRENIHRAWDFAVEQGIAEELLELTRGMETIILFQGQWSDNLIVSAKDSLRQHGASEINPALLYLQLMGAVLLDHRDARRYLLNLLSPIKKADDPRLLFWVYERLNRLALENENSEALDWAAKAVLAARETGDDILIKQAEAYLLRTRAAFGLGDGSTRQMLQKMLVNLEPDFPNSFAVYDILWSLAEHYRAISEYEPAIDYGQRCLNIAKDWPNVFWISRANRTLAGIYLQLNIPDRAKHHLLDTLEWHLAVGQEWQTIGYLYAVCLDQPQLVGGPAAAVSTISMVYQHPEAPVGYRRAIEDGLPPLEEQLGTEAFNLAWDQGKGLDFDTAVARVRSALESAEK
jgi:DNA-binding SARP family transcriptional activator/predicted ATPase